MNLNLVTHLGFGGFRVEDATYYLKGHEQAVLGMGTNHVDKCVCSVSADFTARLWDVEAGTCVSELKGHHGAVRDLCFAPDGKTVLTAGDDCVKLWDRSTGRVAQTLKGHFGHVTCVDCVDKEIGGIADGLNVLTGGWDQSLKFWDLRVGFPIRVCLGHTAPITGCFISQDHSVTYSVGADLLLRIFEIKLGHTLPPFDLTNPPGAARLARSIKMCNTPLNKARMSRDRGWLASTTTDGGLALTKLGPDATTLLRMREDEGGVPPGLGGISPAEGGGGFSWDCDWRSDGKMIIYTCGNEVLLWGVKSDIKPVESESDQSQDRLIPNQPKTPKHHPDARCLARLKGTGLTSKMWGSNPGRAWGCCFLDDAVLAGGGDGTIAVWRIDKEIQGEFGSCVS